MIDYNYVQQAIDTILFNFERKNSNYMFIKHYSTFTIEYNDIENALKDRDKDIMVLYHQYSYNEIQGAYEPFMFWLRQIYESMYKRSMSIDEFIDSCDVYPVQKELFVSYIKSGVCTRYEDIIVNEKDYEKRKFIMSLEKILKKVSNEKKIILVFDKFHLANHATVNFVSRLIKNESEMDNIAILALYNETFILPSYIEDCWNSLMEYLDSRSFIHNWVAFDSHKEEVTENVFIPKAAYAQEYIKRINNMVHTYAIEDAGYYLDIIYKKIEFENLSIPYEDKKKLYCLYGYLSLFSEIYNQTLLMAEGIRQMINKDDDVMLFKSYYLSGMAYIHMNQIETAEQMCRKCEQIAEEMGDSYYVFKAGLLKYMITYFGWIELYAFYKDFEADIEFLRELEQRKYYNHLAHIYVFGYEKDKNNLASIPKVFESFYIPAYLKKGMDLAETIGNDSLITIAYMNNIDFYRGVNNFKYIEHIYNECIKIAMKNKDKNICADMYNGIGYNSSLVEKYVQANEYYNKALCIFYADNDPAKMGETIYNMGVNCMMAYEYQKGLEYIGIAVNILDMLGYQGYRVCKKSKLYGLSALANYYLEADYNCYMYINKIERIVHHIILDEVCASSESWEDDIFLYYFVMGVMAKKNGELKEAASCFEIAEKMSKASEPFRCFSYPLLSVEKARLFRNMGYESKAVNELEQCIEYCSENGYYERRKYLIAELEKRTISHTRYDLPFIDITVDEIFECVKEREVEIELQKKMDDIDFLSRWQEKLDREENDIELMIENSMTSIKNNFWLDNIMYLKTNSDNKLELIFQCGNEDKVILNQNDIEVIEQFFNKNKSAFIINRNDKYFMEYQQIINIFGIEDVVTMMGVPMIDNEHVDSVLIAVVNMHKNFYSNRQYLNEDNLFVIKYIFGQFVDAVERLRSHKEIEVMNHQLEIIASTDMLTGLLNRQGFMDIIKKQMNEIYMRNMRNEKNVLLYIDLDNFKYYNDTVGHEMGDLVLVLFAEILKKSIEKSGYAVRYGGDEFILMLFDEDVNYGVEVAKNIYKQIEGGFLDEISGKLNKNIEIAPEKMISCCIGIAEFDSCDEDSIEIALNHADEALYYVKKTTKHNYKVWQPED